MAVPKRKTSKAKKRSRRTHKKLNTNGIIFDPNTGQYRRNHRVSKDGMYNGINVMEKDANDTEE